MTDWNAISALAGGASALFAGYSIFDATRQRRVQSRRDLARDVRQNLILFQELIDNLRDGRTLLVVADRFAARFIQAYQPTNKQELLAAMADLYDRVSRIVDWIEQEPSYQGFRRYQSDLISVSSSLGARIPIFTPLSNMLIAIARDAISPSLFRNLFMPEILNLLARDIPDTATASEIERRLSDHLTGNTAMYFQARYGKALNSILQIFSSMSDVTLQRLADRGNFVSIAPTFTGQMREYVQKVKPVIGGSTARELLTRISELEGNVSKEGASDELERAKS